LLSYDADIPGNPCDGIAGCDISTPQTFDIPLDWRVGAGQDGVVGTTDDIVQKSGAISAFGGYISAVSPYVLSGTYAGSSSTYIDVTIVPQQSSMVLAWGGHIATRMDWGTLNSAINLTGSPYHMRSLTGGNQDRSLSLDAIIFPGQVTVTKKVQGPNGLSSSDTAFSYTASNFGTNGFALVDNNITGPDRITKSVVIKSASPTVSITEQSAPGWNLSSLTCTSASGGLGSTDNNVISGNAMTLVLEEAEVVECTSISDQLGTLAADVSISGYVTTQRGFGIKGATITVFNTMTLESHSVKTNNFGRYMVSDLPAGDFYIVTVSHPKHTFQYGTQALTLDDVFENMNFVSNR